MAITKKKRAEVYATQCGHCGYCGNDLEYKNMEVDHITAKCLGGADNIENLMPSCRRCNHYKRDYSVEEFRSFMKLLHKRLERLYTHKVAIDFGIVTIKEFDGIFYFEKTKTL